MKLILSELPETLEHLDHYTGKSVPNWMRKLHPNAAASVLKMEREIGNLIYTDMWRSAEVSLAARASKRGVQRPGYSGHNYGFSIDFDVDGNLKRYKWTYSKFLDILEEYGWHCHRRDGKTGSESWHFNYLGAFAYCYLPLAEGGSKNWAAPVERLILDHYESQFVLTTQEVQQGLKKLRLYNGAIDGKFGPLSKAALEAFQKTWDIKVSGVPDAMTMRTLAFLVADIELKTL